MVDGPAAGLAQLDAAEADRRWPGTTGSHAVRAHLLDLLGDRAAARRVLPAGGPATLSVPEQRYLRLRATQRT